MAENGGDSDEARVIRLLQAAACSGISFPESVAGKQSPVEFFHGLFRTVYI